MDLAKTLDAFTPCEAKVNQLSFDCSKMKEPASYVLNAHYITSSNTRY